MFISFLCRCPWGAKNQAAAYAAAYAAAASGMRFIPPNSNSGGANSAAVGQDNAVLSGNPSGPSEQTTTANVSGSNHSSNPAGSESGGSLGSIGSNGGLGSDGGGGEGGLLKLSMDEDGLRELRDNMAAASKIVKQHHSQGGVAAGVGSVGVGISSSDGGRDGSDDAAGAAAGEGMEVSLSHACVFALSMMNLILCVY